jgi:hypothetical protein
MDESIAAFARLLYRSDDRALADLKRALADWVLFYQQHGQNIDVDVDYLVKHSWKDGADPWGILIDVGILHKWVFEADWREFADEIASGLRELVPARPLVIDWRAVGEDDTKAETVFASVSSQARLAGEILVILDKASDSYPLAFLSVGSVAEAQRLAELIGRGRVMIAVEEGPA